MSGVIVRVALLMRKFIAVLALIAASYSACAAATWVEISQDDERTILVDTDSIISQGKLIKIWVLVDEKSPAILNKDPNRKYLSVKHLWWLNCSDRLFAVGAVLYYAGRAGVGQPMQSTTITAEQLEFHDVTPESVVESALKLSCANSRTKK